MTVSVLRLGLLLSSAYFTLTSLAHWTSFKVSPRRKNLSALLPVSLTP